jgi:hypothetical protein
LLACGAGEEAWRQETRRRPKTVTVFQTVAASQKEKFVFSFCQKEQKNELLACFFPPFFLASAPYKFPPPLPPFFKLQSYQTALGKERQGHDGREGESAEASHGE